jgi:general secretion pathway protein G
MNEPHKKKTGLLQISLWGIFGLMVVGVILSSNAYHIESDTRPEPEVLVDADLKTYATQLRTFKELNGRLPTTGEGLKALVTKPETPLERWHKLFDELPPDPWGNACQYACPSTRGGEYDLYSLGADRVVSDDDIYYEAAKQ